MKTIVFQFQHQGLVFQGGAETISRLQILLKLRSQNGIELHAKEVEKRGLITTKELSYSDLDTHRNEIIEDLKFAEYNDLEDMVFRLELTFSEITEILDTSYIAASSTGYTLSTGIFEMSHLNSMLKSLLPLDVKK